MDGPINGKSSLRFVSNYKKTNPLKFFFLILFLFLTSFLSILSLKKVEVQNINISGSKLFSAEDLANNSSLDYSTRLIFIRTKYIENQLKRNLSLKNISLIKQILPFGLKVLIKTRTPIAYAQRVMNGQEVFGYVDIDGYFINRKYAEKINLEKINVQVSGWQENFKKTISKILTLQKNGNFELTNITFSPNGFLTLKEKDLNTILLGFNPTLIKTQLGIISQLKYQLKKNSISEKIDNIDLTDPENPKIKVFKP